MDTNTPNGSQTTVAFHASFTHREDVACCDEIPVGTLIVVAPDGSVWHPECAQSVGYSIPAAQA